MMSSLPGATVTLVAKEDDVIGGGRLSRLAAPSLNDAGELAFSATHSFTTNMIVKRGAQGAFEAVVKSGATAPGTTGAAFGSLGTRITTINDKGQVLFDSVLNNGVGDASDAADNREGVWLTGGAGLALVARDSSPIPGGNGQRYDIAYVYPLLDESGRVWFHAFSDEGSSTPDSCVLGVPPTMTSIDTSAGGFRIGGGSLSKAMGIWTSFTGDGAARQYSVRATAGATSTTVFSDGDAAPGGGTYKNVNATGVNANGAYTGVAFIGPPQNVYAIFTGSGGPPSLLIKQGDTLPGGVGAVAGFADEPRIADDGSVAFLAVGAERAGLFRIKGTSKQPLAVDDTQAPGLPAGIVFSEVHEHTHFCMNSVGQVAFVTRIAGPGVTFSSNTAVFLAEDDGTVHFMLRTGGPLVVGPGEPETISDIRTPQVANTGGSDGQPRWLNDSGTIALGLGYYDGFDSAIVLARVDTPTPPPDPPGLTRLADGRARLVVTSPAGKPFRLEASTGIGGWTTIYEGVIPGTFTDNASAGMRHRFYRAVIGP